MEHCLDRYRSGGQTYGGALASTTMCECATVRGPASQCFASEQLARKRESDVVLVEEAQTAIKAMKRGALI
jgi:hypothetical protein